MVQMCRLGFLRDTASYVCAPVRPLLPRHLPNMSCKTPLGGGRSLDQRLGGAETMDGCIRVPSYIDLPSILNPPIAVTFVPGRSALCIKVGEFGLGSLIRTAFIGII